MSEGTLIFPNEPLLRIHANLIEAQIIEGLVLNHINFQSLIATKSARVWLASKRGKIMEFGLRRAQGSNGAMAASRAAFIGGAGGTSNTLALVEVKEPFCWMDPTADITLADLEKGINQKDSKVGSSHAGGINAALFDGSVKFIPEVIDSKSLKALGTRAGGENVTFDEIDRAVPQRQRNVR